MDVTDNQSAKDMAADYFASMGLHGDAEAARNQNRFRLTVQAFAAAEQRGHAQADAELVAALYEARNDLLEVGNDYPGSSCQKWCTERAASAWSALKPWQHCPSTHCERTQECRSVNECSAEKSTTRAALSPPRVREADEEKCDLTHVS